VVQLYLGNDLNNYFSIKDVINGSNELKLS